MTLSNGGGVGATYIIENQREIENFSLQFDDDFQEEFFFFFQTGG